MSWKRRIIIGQDIVNMFMPDEYTMALWQIKNNQGVDIVNNCYLRNNNGIPSSMSSSYVKWYGYGIPYGMPMNMDDSNEYTFAMGSTSSSYDVFDTRYSDWTVDYFFTSYFWANHTLLRTYLGSTQEFYVYYNNSGVLYGQRGTNTATQLSSTITVNQSGWNHVALCYDHNSKNLTIFLNGQYVSSLKQPSTNTVNVRTFKIGYRMFVCNLRVSNIRRWWVDTIQSVDKTNYNDIPLSTLPRGTVASSGVLTTNQYYCAVGTYRMADSFVQNPIFYLYQSGSTITVQIVRSGSNKAYYIPVETPYIASVSVTGSLGTKERSYFSKTIKDVINTFNGMTITSSQDEKNPPTYMSQINGYILGNGYIVNDTSAA